MRTKADIRQTLSAGLGQANFLASLVCCGFNTSVHWEHDYFVPTFSFRFALQLSLRLRLPDSSLGVGYMDHVDGLEMFGFREVFRGRSPVCPDLIYDRHRLTAYIDPAIAGCRFPRAQSRSYGRGRGKVYCRAS